MKKRPGFTLAELILAVMIFGFMATSLATIYSTSHRHMFQNYRANIIKTSVGVAMRAVQNNLTAATRVDVPVYGGSGNVLAFATNVDQLTGCYPVGPGPAAWHYFCTAPDATLAGVTSLYYHTATITGGSGCSVSAPTTWSGTYPVAFCGFNGGGTVTLLMQSVNTATPLFSRAAADGISERDLVRVHLRSLWSASGRGFGKSQRDVDFTLESVFQVHRYAW